MQVYLTIFTAQFNILTDKKLHIVSLDVPFPPDYGGMIDVFYRLKALHELGYSISLHCFTYGRGKPEELKQYCDELYFYERKKSPIDLLSTTPFIVKTRASKELLHRLLADDAPILFEGTHCSWFLNQPEISNRKTILRAHDLEWEYYQNLKENASGWKKWYYALESWKLKVYEPKIFSKATYVLGIKESEVETIKKHNPNTYLLPSSLPEISAEISESLKDYCLFQGNLSVEENDLSAQWLLDEVFSDLPNIQLIIAGKNPSVALRRKVEKSNHQLVENPTNEEMSQLIAEAKVHVLPTTNSSGLKLKLMAALQTYGRVIVNSKVVEGNKFGPFCVVANSTHEFKSAVQQAMVEPMGYAIQKERVKAFQQEINFKESLKRVFEIIF